MKRYNPAEIEPKWQQVWANDARYQAPDESSRPKYYVTGMFPYPSGAGMHTGHFFEHSIVDAIARFRRANGHNVVYPMGWDAFGLPAENYAIKTGTAPSASTKQNIANFTNQLKRVGASIDWSREITTSDPEYYKWTQWVFTEFYKRDLAYQKEANQWWCPVDKTVLANEQVEAGKCWRCGSEVVKKSMKQWFFKITDYADALLEETPQLDWPEKIKNAQTNWIGKSQGAEIDFRVAEHGDVKPNFLILHGFTGRADKNWLPWIKNRLEEQGYEVQTPQLPDTENPVERDQVEYVLNHCRIDENTVLIGHSLGGAVAMKVLEKIEHNIRKLILVAPVVEASFRGPDYEFENPEKPRTFIHTFDLTYDYEDIKQKTSHIVILSENGEADVRKPYLEYLTAKLGATFLETTGEGKHFTGVTESFILDSLDQKLTVFTTRPDTLFGATFMVIAPEHPMLSQLVNDDTREAVDAYIANALKKSEIERQSEGKEKTGVFTGAYAVNPATGEKIPIWVADYVLGGYGTGAIMAVPAHDERDLAFAEKFDLSVIQVIDAAKTNGVVAREGVLINSEQFDGIRSEDAREQVVGWLEKQGLGRTKTTYKMRDWLISRQRYWGAPIPIIHCPNHGAVAVPEKDLPVLLPEVDDYEPKGESVLASQTDWVNTVCPECGKPATRETDTMDGYACSSWYLLRYTDPHNTDQAWDPDKANYWTPVDTYVGGDHAVAHLLYVRFWSHVFYNMKLVAHKEPVKKLVYHGYINAEDGTKMSKSKGNVVDPLEVIDAGYGADALRTFELFLGPINENSDWSSTGIAGVYRFLNRVWTLTHEYLEAEKSDSDENNQLLTLQHRTIKKVTGDIHRLSFNTAIAALMEYVNELYKLKTKGYTHQWQQPLESLTQLVQPFAPHMAAELWQLLGHEDKLDFVEWPVWDEAFTIAETMTIIVQVNGKVRAKLEVATNADAEDIKADAIAEDNVQKFLGNKKPTKVIYIPGRLVSVVI